MHMVLLKLLQYYQNYIIIVIRLYQMVIIYNNYIIILV